MDKNVKMYLIWTERLDADGVHRFKEFNNLDSLNSFLNTLNGDDVTSIRVIAGLLLEHREGNELIA